MGFLLTDEQKLFQSIAREFARTHVEPLAAELDRDQRFPAETMKKLAELDLTGIHYPPEYGGGGADYLSFILVIEELSRACASTGVILATQHQPAMPILEFGTPEQKARFVPMLTGYQTLGAFAITEAGAGTDAAAQMTNAVLDGDYWVLNGAKKFVTNGDEAGLMIVMARTGSNEDHRGLSLFIVEKSVSPWMVGKHEDKMGMRGCQTTEILFKNCRVPKDNLIGKMGEGFKYAMETLNAGRIAIAAQGLGVLQACLDESVRYAKERHQFGRPLAANQAIQWMIADMAKDTMAARLLVYNAAALMDQGKPFLLEAATAKLFAAEAAMHHAGKAVQIQGGYGYMKGSKVERLMRDAKIIEIYEGTVEVQRMVISGQLLR
jgi:butyryl-CoA dehydrogenase